MTIPRNLSFLAEGASSTGVLGTANGGTGLSTVGSNGQVLTSNGSTLSFATASAGAMTLISTKTASASASLSWTGLTGYDKYILYFQNIILSNAPSTQFALQIGTGSTTYLTSGYYWSNLQIYGASATVAGFSQAINGVTSYWGLCNAYNASGQINGTVSIYGMTSGSNTSMNFQDFFLQNTGSNYYEFDTGSGTSTNSTAKTAIQIYPISGTITSGTASLYGISS
jgi:hypothetical protein